MLADLILKNANVITMDPACSKAGLVAVKGDKIGLVGDDKDLDSVTGPQTRVIDCRGKTVLPGFNDAHCHIFSAFRKLLSLDLGPSAVLSIADIKAAIRREVEKTPQGGWISGVGFNEFYLAEKRFPTRRDIDEFAPNNPVVLSHRSLHACVLNSLALSLAGINRETPEPPGTLIERELDTGEPNGILYEMLGHIREKVMPPISEEVLIKCAAQANRHYLSCGITSLQDATVTNDYKRWLKLERLTRAEILQSRLYMMTGRAGVGEFREAGLKTGSGDERLKLGAVKLMLTATARPTQSELNKMALDLRESGFQLAFHAVEPDMVADAIAALEYVNSRNSIAGSRHRIEHCAECPPDLLKRLTRLPVVVVTQPPFVYYSGERYLATLSAERLSWLYRFKSFFDSGLIVAGSSDSPIVPDSPLVGMCAAVTRQAASGQAVLPHESIPVEQTVAMYTANAAYASGEENIKGSITPGKLADMVILSADPTVIPPEEIRDIKVEMTIIGGKVVFET